jgi:hypothetical protein
MANICTVRGSYPTGSPKLTHILASSPLKFQGQIFISAHKASENQITRRFQTFINKRLKRIMNIKRTNKNEELWRITKQKPIEIQVKGRKWNWIRHTLRKGGGAIEKPH